MTDFSGNRVRRSHGAATYERLARIKAKYDPGNVFPPQRQHPADLTDAARAFVCGSGGYDTVMTTKTADKSGMASLGLSRGR
jgi:hypothetical protein